MSSRQDDLKSSVISLVPFALEEEKWGIYPGSFKIPAAKNNIPEILVVGDSIYYVEVDVGRSIPVTTPSYKIAQSIVDDYINSSIGINAADPTCGPGLFWVIGTFDLNRVYKECTEELEVVRSKQLKWFTRLIEMADDDWEKTRQHRAVTDMQRIAAKILNLDRPWIVSTPETIKALITKNCPSCQNLISDLTVVCPQCKCIIDIDRYKQFQFAGA